MKAGKGRSWNMKTFHISEYSAEGLKIEGPHQLPAWEVLTTVYRALAPGYFSDLRPLLPLSTSLPLSPICFRGKGKGSSGISLISKEYTKEAIIDHTSYKGRLKGELLLVHWSVESRASLLKVVGSTYPAGRMLGAESCSFKTHLLKS